MPRTNEVSTPAINVANRVEFSDFDATLQTALDAVLVNTRDEVRADLYARIVTGQERMKFTTPLGLIPLIVFEMRYTPGLVL